MKDPCYFGYQQVELEAKQGLVNQVFHSVANRYDIMNDLMSFGIHRLWKRETLARSGVRPKDYVLDLASGTGDLARLFVKAVGKEGLVIASDINPSMLAEGRERFENEGLFQGLGFALINAETLPFSSNQFDVVSIGFGLRNVPQQVKALKEMQRVLKPGGRALILEFSKPALPGLKPLYDAYSFSILPWLGKVVAHDAESYRYLAESIRRHPDQETLKSMMLEAGFDQVNYFNMSGGIVALHVGMKF